MPTRKTLLLTLLCLISSLITLLPAAHAQDAFKEDNSFNEIDKKTDAMITRLYYKHANYTPSTSEAFYRSRRQRTPFEAALQLYRFTMRVKKDNNDTSPSTKPTFSKEDIKVMRGLVERFKMLFPAHGQNAKTLLAILDTVPPFLDVPPMHWAFTAVQVLKEADIFVGYPTQGKNTFLYHAPKH